ncbi:MAG: hypothetical protein KAU12_01840 [Candidatus Omnitrophica bacterium]|nr:hypothetical protein [Candidatus Omnitrophota bacterium]
MLKKLKNLFSYFKKNEILVIDFSNDAIKAIVVKKEGEKVVVLAKAEAHRPRTAGRALQIEDVSELLENLKKYPKRVVLVSSEVKFLSGELPISPDMKISSDKLREAVRWEAQPYLDFSVSEGLFGCQLQKNSSSVKKGFSKEINKSQKTTPVFITAISKEEYSYLKDVCKRCGLILEGIYAGETAFAYSVNCLSGTKAKRVILNFKRNSIAGALLNSGSPVVFQSAPFDAVEKLVSELAAGAEKITEVIITGSQDERVEGVINRLKRSLRFSIRQWRPQADIFGYQVKNFPRISPRFAACAGAVLQELNISHKNKLAISDRISLVKLLKLKIHILPLIAVGIVVVGILSHYLYIKSSFWQDSLSIKKLEIERNELKANMSILKGLKFEIKDSCKKRRYIKEVLPARHRALLGLFDGITGEIPGDIILDKISQDSANTFFLEGSGLSAGSITAFVGSLERLAVSREARLESINEKKADVGDANLFLYKFRIRVDLE